MRIVHLVTSHTFATKTRGYGLLPEVDGADEGLTDAEIISKVRSIKGGIVWPFRMLFVLPVQARDLRF